MLEYIIWFSMIRIPYHYKINLIKEYGSLENIWFNCFEDKIENKELLNKLKDSWDREKIDKIKQVIIDKGIQAIYYNDPKYPKKLKQYDDAPSVLFYIGNITKLDEGYNISIVGSRRCTSYGINVTKVISAELAKHNINVISGLARGIDAHAHAACIENNGYTCAILGCGLDIIYPKENKNIYEAILDNGCIISEFLPGTQPIAYNFPVRNRIISELSDLVIVVEAGLKSGSLITAGLALEHGIDVMAVPASIFSEQSKGSNLLIKDGAYPLTSIEDIFQLLNVNYSSFIEKETNLNGMEKKVYDFLSDNPIHINDIINLANIDIKHLYEVLFELQLKDEIMCLAGNYYVKNNKSL